MVQRIRTNAQKGRVHDLPAGRKSHDLVQPHHRREVSGWASRQRGDPERYTEKYSEGCGTWLSSLFLNSIYALREEGNSIQGGLHDGKISLSCCIYKRGRRLLR